MIQLHHKADDLEDLLIIISDYDSSIVVLEEYEQTINLMKCQGDNYPMEQAIRLLEILEMLEPKLKRLADMQYEQYRIYLDLAAICLE